MSPMSNFMGDRHFTKRYSTSSLVVIFISLKVQSCRLYKNKYMIALKQITNTEIFAFIAVLVFKLLTRKVLFTNRKDNRKR